MFFCYYNVKELIFYLSSNSLVIFLVKCRRVFNIFILISEDDIDKSIYKNIITQLKLGMYDKLDESPYATFGTDSINNQYHVDLASKAAEKSMILLKTTVSFL